MALQDTKPTTAPQPTENEQLAQINADYEERYGFHDAENYLYKAPKGLTRELVAKISEFKSEPQWMRDFRLKALEHFLARPQPTWGSPLLNEVDYDNIHYFVRASERAERSWDDVPEDVKKTFDRLGIPEAERKFLSGVGAQYESESVYHQVNEQLEAQGVLFMDMDTALREHEDLVHEYIATLIPANSTVSTVNVNYITTDQVVVDPRFTGPKLVDAFGEDGRHHLRGPRPGRRHVVAHPRQARPRNARPVSRPRAR